MIRAFLQLVGVIGTGFLVLLAFSILTHAPEQVARVTHENPAHIATTTVEAEATTSPVSTTASTSIKKAVTKVQKSSQTAAVSQSASDDPNEVRRIENPYTVGAKSKDTLYELAHTAVVNIFCESNRGPFGAVSGSGVIIDPRGVVLTNAHVAQFLLLATDPRFGLQCSIRTGAPAQKRWRAEILYVPSAWVNEHAADISNDRPKGTGAHDYALLFITDTTDGSPLPKSFPYVPPDVRDRIAFTSDSVLIAGYPAEFAGSNASFSQMYILPVFGRVGDLLTYTEHNVDLFSVGNVPLAQSGSSGGGVINLWGYMVGLISTTSEGTTTAQRDLRAISLAYIDRDLRQSIGQGLPEFLAGNLAATTAAFMSKQVPVLAGQIIANIR